MYREVSTHIGEYRLGDGSPFCWVTVSHRGSARVLYDHWPCHLSRMKWPSETAVQMSEKSPPLLGREVGEVYLHNRTLDETTCTHITKGDVCTS